MKPIELEIKNVASLYTDANELPKYASGLVYKNVDRLFAFTYAQNGIKGFWHVYIKNKNKYGWIKEDDITYANGEYEKVSLIRSLGLSGDAQRMVQAKQYTDTLVILEAKLNQYDRRIKEIEEQIDSIKNAAVIEIGKKNGMLINEFSWGYTNDYSSFVDVHLSIMNFSKKTIKYLNVYVAAKNAVGDRISSFGKQTFQVRGIGPIEQYDVGTYDFENVIYSKVVDDVYLYQIVVEYMDGTKKTYAQSNLIFIEAIYQAFENSTK